MKSLKKKKFDPSQESESSDSGQTGGAGGKGRPSVVIKQALQDKAIDLIKAGNTEALADMINDEVERIFINRVHTKTGKTCIGTAAEEGRLEALQMLIKAASPEIINTRDKNFMTPILYAAKEDCMPALEMLLAAEGDLTLDHTPTGESALFLAAKGNHVNMVQFLIGKLLEVDIKNTRGETPLWNALKCAYFPLAELLIARMADINVKRSGGDTPLHAACFGGHLDTVQFILNNDGNILAQNDNGEDPLTVASRHGYLEIVELLVQRGANVNSIDNCGKTPLAFATISLKVDVVKFLLDNKADPNIHDKWGYSPLIFACRMPAEAGVPIVRLLVSAGAQIDFMDKTFTTPLMHACLRGNFNLAVQLLDRGADPSLLNIDDKAALDFVPDGEAKDVILNAIERSLDYAPTNRKNTGARERPQWVVDLNIDIAETKARLEREAEEAAAKAAAAKAKALKK